MQRKPQDPTLPLSYGLFFHILVLETEKYSLFFFSLSKRELDRVPKRHAAVQVSGYREYLSLSLDCSRDRSFARCYQVNDLLSLVAELWNDVRKIEYYRFRKGHRMMGPRGFRSSHQKKKRFKNKGFLCSFPSKQQVQFV